jgi:hypothetical protein
MQHLEIIFALTTLFLLVLSSFYGKSRKPLKITFLIGSGFLVLHFVFETIRWQMIFIYLIFIILSLFLLKRSIAHLVFRWIGFFFGLLFMFTSVFFAIGMPVITLPEPTGKYDVGTSSFSLMDEERDEIHTDDTNDKRELFIEVWYPGALHEPVTPKSLWSELYSGQRDVVRFTLNYLKRIKTHSYPDIPPALDEGQFPLLLFNHGLQMFTSQSTMLMEHLASNGYIVVSIAHPYESLRVNLAQGGTVLPEFITSLEKFKEAMEWIKKTSGPIVAAQDSIKSIESREERGEIMLRAIRNADLNLVVEEWTKDNQYVLDRILTPEENPLNFPHLIDTTRIGIMGMSIGGATAGEFCKIDQRVKAGINVDGLQYGTTQDDSLNLPFMMVYSDDGLGLNDFMMLRSKQDYYEFHLRDTRHADFTDMILVWPVMKVYGQLGKIPGERVIELTNRIILNFWDHYLKQKPFYKFQEADYPELEVGSKYASQKGS